MLELFKIILDKLNKALLLISIVTLLIILIVNLINILMRITLSNSLPWALELSLLLHIYSIFFGMCVVYHNKKTIIMTLILNRCSSKYKLFLELFSETLIMVFLIFLIFYSIKLGNFVYSHMSPGIGVSRVYAVVPITTAAFILLLNSFYNITVKLSELIRKQI